MTSDAPKAKRVLHVKLRAPSPDMGSVAVSMMKSAIPFYEAFGEARVRVLRSVDDPSAFLQVIEYQTDAAFELNRQKLSSDPLLQSWRALFAGVIEIDVYEDVTASV